MKWKLSVNIQNVFNSKTGALFSGQCVGTPSLREWVIFFSCLFVPISGVLILFLDSFWQKRDCLRCILNTHARRCPLNVNGLSFLWKKKKIQIFFVSIQTKVTESMSHLGTGELFSLIMNTLGSYELKRECAFDTSTPSISRTVFSLFALCHICHTRLLWNGSVWQKGRYLYWNNE